MSDEELIKRLDALKESVNSLSVLILIEYLTIAGLMLVMLAKLIFKT